LRKGRYPKIKQLIEVGNFQNVLFNLDQCGTSQVGIGTIRDIIGSFASAEIFYTFGIETLISFLNKSNPEALARKLEPLGVSSMELGELDLLMSKQAWLGAAERIVFEAFRSCARYVSPFSIHSFRQLGACSTRIQ
jgi:three-Cys-motif partner protein